MAINLEKTVQKWFFRSIDIPLNHLKAQGMEGKLLYAIRAPNKNQMS